MNKFLVTTAVGAAFLAISSLSMAADSTTSTTTTSTTTTSVTTAKNLEASNIMKADIKTKSGNTLGVTQDIIIGRDGIVVGVVADVSDFLGLAGDRDVLLDWKSLTISGDGDKISVTTDLDKKAIEKKPIYKAISG